MRWPRAAGAMVGARPWLAFVLAAVLSIAPALAAPATQAPSQGTAAPEGETISTVQADAHREQAPDSADADADAVSGEPADPADAVRKAALEAEAGETAHDAQTDNDPVESAHEAGGAPTVVTSAELDKEAEGAEAAPAADEPAGIAGEVAADNGPDTHWPVKQGPMPYEIVRSLQFLQDQIARGNVPALKVQAMLLRRYGPTFSEADASVWKDGRNLRAAVLFVLSGGSPSALRWIMAKTDLKGDNRTLFEGALAYMDNDVATAESKLSSLDLTFVESSLAAQIDLVIAQLQQNTKPREALGRLSKVMVTAPGTLLDEAALRMGVILAEDLGERRLSDQFVRQYFDRYSRSAYAGNFRARFAAIYAERPIGTEDDTMATIKDATAMLPADQQLALYLAVGRRALINGNLVLAAKAADKALTYPVMAVGDRQRALLYEVAATLTKRDFAEVAATLAAIDPAKLHPADAKLRSAALDVVAQMRQPLLVDAKPDLPQATVVEAANASDVLARGNALLDAVKNDLQRATQ